MKLFIKLLPDQSPGNSVVLTTAVRDLKRANPDWKLNVGGGAVRDFFQNNPNIDSSVTEKTADKIVTAEYPFRGSMTKHYLYSYTESICCQLGIRIRRGEFRPELFLSKSELSLPRKITEPYWVLNSGYRTNISAKYWGDEHFRQLVFEFKNKIRFVQIGGKSNDLQNPPLSGTIDLRGKTSFRELILLIYHSEGVVSPVSMPMHIAAAFRKPAVIIAGGREQPNWTGYDDQIFLHTVGRLDCCRKSGCFKRRVLPLGDGKKFDNSICADPVLYHGEPIPHCMEMLDVEYVANAIRLCCRKNDRTARIQPSTAAGKNYPASPSELTGKINQILAGGAIKSNASVFISPHHDYDRAGKCYSEVFRRMIGREILRVIILAPSHFSNPGETAVLTDVSCFQTPSGFVENDKESARKLCLNPAFRIDPEIHQREHSAQTLFPLIRAAAPDARVLPVLVGHPTLAAQQQIADALRPLIDSFTVVLVSSDFTHYGSAFHYTPFPDDPLGGIAESDRSAAAAIMSGDPAKFETFLRESGATICGRFAILTAMRLIDLRGTEILAENTSHETDGDSSRIVSYVTMGK